MRDLKQRQRRVVRLLICAALLLAVAPTRSVRAEDGAPVPEAKRIVRLTPMALALAAPLDQPEAEISALAWYREGPRRWLALLPEDGFAPSKTAIGHTVYLMARRDLLRQARGVPAAMASGDSSSTDTASRAPAALEAVPITYALDPVSRAAFGTIEKHDGYEALLFVGRTAYLTVEQDFTSGSGWLLRGRLEGREGARRLVLTTAHALPPPPRWNAAKLRNKSYESLVLTPGGIAALWECHGPTAIAGTPYAPELPRAFDAASPITWRRMPAVPYRITDAASMQASTNTFWVMNYYFDRAPEGCDAHRDVTPEQRALWAADTQTNSDGKHKHIERLLEMRWERGGFARTGTPPLWLELLEAPRNWEGLVRLRDGTREGFVLATDKYPGSLAVLWRQP